MMLSSVVVLHQKGRLKWMFYVVYLNDRQSRQVNDSASNIKQMAHQKTILQ